jgi:hypothetical protein
MDVCQPTLHRPSSATDMAVPQPGPDYGTFGPACDIPLSGPNSFFASAQRTPRIRPAAAVAVGVVLAVLVGSVGTARAAWEHITILFSTNGNVERSAAGDPATRSDLVQLDRLEPQTQAQALLEQAVADSNGAVEQISARVDRWQGKIKWNSEIANLTTAALTSRDVRVRQSGVEVELAAYGLAKNAASLNYLLHTAKSRDHAKKIWALWSLGLLANRGVGTTPAVQALTTHLQDSDQDSRRWAVAGLAMVGSPETIAPLLRTMHDDPSPSVREGAASSLAESGMLTQEQRLAAVPQLLNYTEDPALDAQTRTWAFQALSCITGQRLPNDSGTWRLWYTSAKLN